MKIFVLVLVAIAVAAEAVPAVFNQEDIGWELYKLQYNKSYASTLEESLRKQIFLENKKEVSKHNENFKNGLTTYTMRINHFSDLLPSELDELHPPIMDNKDNAFAQFRAASFIESAHNVDLPKAVDWRLLGAVTPVKNQGECGSCWAFSATGGLEGQLFRKTGKLVSLSEQNLIDCAKLANGCVAGSLPNAYHYVRKHGVDTEDSYPFEARKAECRYNETNVAVRIEDYRHIKQGDEMELMTAVATAGPIPVCIDTRPSFHHYSQGVYHEDNCSKENTNHCVLVVGYGTADDGQDYWIVKNSWGSHNFGEGGYIRMARNRNNMCAIATFAYLPVL